MQPSAMLREHLAREEPAGDADVVPRERRRRAATSWSARVWQRYQEYLGRTRALDFDDLLLERGAPAARERAGARGATGSATATSWSTSTRTRTTRSTSIVRALGERAPQRVRGRRRRPVDLRLARRRHPQDPRLRPGLPGRQDRAPADELPLDAADPERRQHGHPPELLAPREGAASRRAATASPCASCASRTRSRRPSFVVERDAQAPAPGARRSPKDFAILCRTQVQFRAVRDGAARANGLPYVVVGGMSFFDRKEVRDVIAFLKLAANAARRDRRCCASSTRRPRGVGKASIDRVIEFATEHGDLRRGGVRTRGRDRGRHAAGRSTGYRALRDAVIDSGREDATDDLVAQAATRSCRSHRLPRRGRPAPTRTRRLRDARWQGVVEVLNFAENHVRRAAKPSLHKFLRGAGAVRRRRSRRQDREDPRRRRR